MGPDGLRPPGDAFVYQAAYVVGILCLIAIAWALAKFFKSQRARFCINLCTLIIAIVAAIALHEEFKIQRAETCYNAIQLINRGESSGIRTHYGLYVRKDADGIIRTSSGTPDDVESYLRRKYADWFTGTLISIRNKIFPASACTLPAASASK